MILRFISFFLVLVLVYSFNGEPTELVKVQLYYETLCGDCVEFSAILKKVVLKLGQYLDVHTYPFGNARFLPNGTIECQFGPQECYGNKLHACAIDLLKNITSAVIYNACMMDSSVPNSGFSDDTSADACGKLLNVDSEWVKNCAKSSKGEDLLVYYGKESSKVQYGEVPWVLVNGLHVKTEERYFIKSICNQFENPPKECDNI